jgi:hypothetical protein
MVYKEIAAQFKPRNRIFSETKNMPRELWVY